MGLSVGGGGLIRGVVHVLGKRWAYLWGVYTRGGGGLWVEKYGIFMLTSFFLPYGTFS